ncbi:hypothetical protein CEY04_16940 [Achromobacter sp. HZ28]|nr:hypothetical protein CEY04_16940 [Achromobacter sp. HZ28]OWT75954.1 hypothetical protein CEY05_12390 [Achromobacter sp. HZ34]
MDAGAMRCRSSTRVMSCVPARLARSAILAIAMAATALHAPSTRAAERLLDTDMVLPSPESAAMNAAVLASTAPANNYVLNQAITGLDMLDKVADVCPRFGREDTRATQLETIARARLKVSARAIWRAQAVQQPPVFMTPTQARRIVTNAGGCESPALAQWRAGAMWLADTSAQVLAGEAPADLVWPRQAALERPVRVTVLGWQLNLDRIAVQVLVSNEGSTPVRAAFLAAQSFAGLCTRLEALNVPMAAGFLPAQWADVPPRGSVPALWLLDPSCKSEPRMNVGGAIVIDQGKGPVYRRFLLRGVGPAPVQKSSARPPG